MAELGVDQRAIEIYALASRNPYLSNSRWFSDIAGGYIGSIAVTLLSKVIVAARERNQCLDLETTVAEILDKYDGKGNINQSKNPLMPLSARRYFLKSQLR
jgi:hypothetical protein